VAYTDEDHHIIPQAWQLFVSVRSEQPSEAPHKSASFALSLDRAYRIPDDTGVAAEKVSGRLFDPRTITLCPTGHRNVHVWIVSLMKAIVNDVEDPEASIHVVRRAEQGAASGGEFDTAVQALVRFKAAGHSLQALRDVKLWGQA
jgi:hypothetical protein